MTKVCFLNGWPLENGARKMPFCSDWISVKQQSFFLLTMKDFIWSKRKSKKYKYYLKEKDDA